MVVLDTNILVYFFEGEDFVKEFIYQNEVAVSSITYIELLSNKKLTTGYREIVEEYLQTLFINQTSHFICETAIKFSLTYNIKAADAIIAATAKFLNLPLVTADTKLHIIKEIEIIKIHKK